MYFLCKCVDDDDDEEEEEWGEEGEHKQKNIIIPTEGLGKQTHTHTHHIVI